MRSLRPTTPENGRKWRNVHQWTPIDTRRDLTPATQIHAQEKTLPLIN